MQVTHANFHNYISMSLDFTTVGQVKITFLYYTNEIIYAFDKAYTTGGGTKSSAAPGVIFKANKDYEKLNSNQDVECHHQLAKMLFYYQAGKNIRMYRNFIPHH